MTSFRQWQANRCNAAKSTGPSTREGKEHSRGNAVRHGLAVMETGLFATEADHLSGAISERGLQPPAREVVYAFFRSDRGGNDPTATTRLPALSATIPQEEEPAADPAHHFARGFLQLANLLTYPLDRFSRYEYALWRQVAQVLFALDNLNRRKPQEKRGPRRGGTIPIPNGHRGRFDDD